LAGEPAVMRKALTLGVLVVGGVAVGAFQVVARLLHVDFDDDGMWE
jgi:hypothetical protein